MPRPGRCQGNLLGHQANIDDDELDNMRALAKTYALLSENLIAQFLGGYDLTEVCNGNEKQV